MKLLTQDAIITCQHATGIVGLVPTQDWVTINARLILVDNNPENRPIAGCPNIGATIKPCINTLSVNAGYSDLLKIDGKRVCLDPVTGLTDGTPPGVVKYEVRSPGQILAGADL